MKSIPVALFLCIQLFCHGTSQAQVDRVVPPGEAVADLSQPQWSRAWWQWAGSFEQRESPIADTTGALCGARQSGPVWFLAGTYATKRTVRTCKVPRGKYLFFPLINYVVMPPATRPVTCSAVMDAAAEMTNDPSALVLEIDGVRVQSLASHRLVTRECFDMGLLSANKLRVYPSAANGYYAMLRPLEPGTHTINFGGALPNMLQAVTYTLQVE